MSGGGRRLEAERGRLVRRIEEWTSAAAMELVAVCSARVCDQAARALVAQARTGEAAALAAVDGDTIEAAAVAIAAAGNDEASRLAGFAADVVRYAREAAAAQ